MKYRLQKILSEYGISSRRKAEEIILDGRVSVNGKMAGIGDSADPNIDIIIIDGVKLSARPERVYIMLNKPRGYITTASDERGRKTVLQLVSSCSTRVFPVGRLDKQSEGLLLLTNDGEFANAVSHPSGDNKKIYRVSVRGNMNGAVEALSKPFDLDGYITKPASVKILSEHGDSGILEISITEGRNRQIRKMCEKCELEVRRLVRIAESGLELSGLQSGQWRYLTDDEVSHIFSTYSKNARLES